jgi:uncharacterized spore protein YtfJ
MDKHPIGDLMETTMQKSVEIVDGNTIVVHRDRHCDGITPSPSQGQFRIASGRLDFQTKHQQPSQSNAIGGGSRRGPGSAIVPVAF